MAATFSYAQQDYLAGVPLPAMALTTPVVVPRGPRGLWDAMARATGGDAGSLAIARPNHPEIEGCAPAVEDPTPVSISAGAHLAYLARLAPETRPAQPIASPAGAAIIDLAAERARRR